jgi:hypothetical protein
VVVDPSVRGNKLREFCSDKCVESPKCRSLEVLKHRSVEVVEVSKLPKCRSPEVSKCFSFIDQEDVRQLSPAPGEK